MKRLKKWMDTIRNSRKFRCGGFSVLLTAAVVAVVLLVGALADSLEKRFALQADYSFNAATSQGDVTRAVLAQLEEDVRLYAVVPDGARDETLLSLLDRYNAATEKVTVTEESLIRNPVLQSRFSGEAGEQQVTDDCLIVHCPATGKTRILTADDYTVKAWNTELWSYQVVQYAYEKVITEAILWVTQAATPTVQILEGHGEMTAEDTSLMESTLESANYAVKRVNLASGDALDPASTLMILSPAYDLAAWEVEKLMDFAAQGGDFFICSRYVDPLDLDNYMAFLRAYGIVPYEGLVMAKEEDTAGYYGAPVVLRPFMQQTPVTQPLIEAGQDLLLLTAARAFHMNDIVPEDVMLTPILLTGQAYIRHYEDGLDVSTRQPGDEEGVFAVGLWVEKLLESGETSQMLVLGDISAFLNPVIQSGVKNGSTAFLTQALRSLQGQTPVNLDILPKEVIREGLSLGDVTPAKIVIVMLPLLVALGAVLVLWPRRNL